MRITLLYLVGFCAVAYGFYEFWRYQHVDPNAFLLGSICIAGAAALSVVADLWRRLRRRRR